MKGASWLYSLYAAAHKAESAGTRCGTAFWPVAERSDQVGVPLVLALTRRITAKGFLTAEVAEDAEDCKLRKLFHKLCG
jgi:hypothetical protein